MNYPTAGRHGSAFMPFRKDAKSPSSEGYACSYAKSARAGVATPARRSIPTTTSRISSTTCGPSRTGSSRLPVSSKWFQDPKIPIRLNSSTLIRMKSKSLSANKEMDDSRTNNQLTVAALSFLKRDRRMSNFEVAKGISPFGDSSYVKSVFLNIVSHRDHRAVVQASANSFGDGVHTDATYHRIAAISLNDCKSGCNLKFVEHVSYKGAAPSPRTVDVDSAGQSNTVVAASKNGANSFSMINLNAMLKQATLTEPKTMSNSGDTSDCDATSEDEQSVGIRPQVTKKKKRVSRKHKKAVVVTSMKNSSLRLMRKSGSRETAT